MAERDKHAHPTTSRKVLVAVGGQDIDEETVRLACRMTDPQGGRLYGVHIIEVNRSLPLGAVLDDVVDRGEKILDEVEKLASASQLPVETELVQAREAAAAIIDTARDRKSDLIVLGMPFRKRLGRVYVGKTVQGVYVGAHCAVLAYRQEETR